jgi:hypothetical protein
LAILVVIFFALWFLEASVSWPLGFLGVTNGRFGKVGGFSSEVSVFFFRLQDFMVFFLCFFEWSNFHLLEGGFPSS